jgi:RimJ/RimL family protein N-acetyltransferase
MGTAAARLVTRFAFDTLNLHEIRAELLDSNLASKRVLEKVGFQFQYVIPDFDQSDLGPLDGCLYALRNSDRGRDCPEFGDKREHV